MNCVTSFFRNFLRGCSDLSTDVVAASISRTRAGATVRQMFMPLNGEVNRPYTPWTREQLNFDINGQTLCLSTHDGLQLDAVWSTCGKPDAPTAIIFHGNGCVLDSMGDYGRWYHQHGMNVLLVTMRGYPGSDGDAVEDGEIGLYLDVEAAVRFVRSQGVPGNKILSHGLSLGGALASAAGKFYNTHVTLDHTFTSAADVATHMIQEQSSTSIPVCLPGGVTKSGFPSGRTYNIPDSEAIEGSKPLVSDGLNSEAKLSDCSGELFVMYGNEDQLMPTYFADRLVQARYGLTEETMDYTVELNGGHCNSPFYIDQDASRKYAWRLVKMGLVEARFL